MGDMNIGDYLSDGGFECAFWTTYSIDFSTAYFIINQHVRPLIQDQPCHIMMDLRKASEACRADDSLRALGKLQSRAIISTCDKRVAFHPKLLLMAGDSKIRLIITSGNATALGVLSDSDLIARFDHDKNKETHKEVRGIIAEGFRFLKSCRGWHPSALATLEKVQTRHPWLAELQSEFFLGSHKGEPLFEQMLQSLGSVRVKKVEIYSPFYDPTLNALSYFRKSFPNIPIEAWAGAGFVELDESFDIDQLSKLGLSLHRPLFKGRDSFHAKVYRFVHEHGSTVFWGSANCSNSALLSTRNSSEVLVKTAMNDEEFRGLFDPLPPKPIGKAHVRPASRKDHDIDGHALKITSAVIEGGFLSFTVSGDDNFSVQVLGNSGQEIASKVLSHILADDGTFTLDISQARFKILAIELIDEFGFVVSHRFPLSNLDSINSSGDTDTPVMRREVEEGRPEVINQIERQYFTFERGSAGSQLSTGSQNQIERDFWKTPKSFHSTIWAAGYPSMSYTAQTKLTELEPETEDNDESDTRPRKRGDKPKRERPILQGWPWALNLTNIAGRNHKRLLKSLNEGIRPNEDRWATGLEHSVKYLIKPLVEAKADLGEDEVYDFADILLHIAQMAAYFTHRKAFTDEELKRESVIARLTSFTKVIDFSYFFSTADIDMYREFHSATALKDDHPESMQRQIRAGFLKIWVYSKFPALNDTFIEQNLADLEEAQRCFRSAKAASSAFRATQRFIGSIATLPIKNPDEGLMFNHARYGPMLIERWLGNRVDCCSLLGEMRSLSTGFFCTARN